jgi:hypothetical protein
MYGGYPMLLNSPQSLQTELDVMERFANAYQERFAAIIRELNSAPTPHAANRSLRLCVETVNMMLENHRTLAMAIRQLSTNRAA